MKINIWRNRAFKSGASVLGYSSQTVNYPAINAISTSPTQKWRTTGRAAEYISIDFGIADIITAIGIYGSNLTDNAQITLYLSNSPDFSGATQISLTGSQVKDKMYNLGANYTNRYAKIAIADTGNSANYLEIGTIWLAGKDLELQPTEFSEKVNIKDIYDTSYNIVGFYLSRPSLRNWSLTARITSSDDVTMLQTIIDENKTSVPFYIESDDDSQIVGHPITTFTRFSETPEINYVYVNYWTASADLIETR